jgi:nicotinamidase-related amidase
VRSRYENGYKAITLKDCVAATSVKEHDNAIA